MYRELVIYSAVVVLSIAIMQLTTKAKYGKIVFLILSILYLAFVIYITLIRGNRSDMSGVNFRLPLPFFRALAAHKFGPSTNRSILNIIMFIPFGFMLPKLCAIFFQNDIKADWISCWKIVLSGFVFSFFIEIMQLVLHLGVFELDDLVKNTMGALIGYGIWSLLNRGRINNK